MRGRVFGVLNMLVSTASFLPIIVVGPVADFVGTTNVIYAVGIAIAVSGVISDRRAGTLKPAEWKAMATGPAGTPAGLDPMAVATASEVGVHERRASRKADRAHNAATAGTVGILAPLEPLEPADGGDTSAARSGRTPRGLHVAGRESGGITSGGRGPG